MAAENIDNTVTGTGLFPAKVPGLADAADIQAALKLYHYGSYTYDGSNTNPANLVTPSIARHLQNLVNADTAATAALAAHEADTTNIHGIVNTANLATQTYVNTAISSAVGGVTGEYSNLAGTAIDWNSVDERFDVEPRLANAGTVITKTESFILSASDVGKTAILYSSNPMTVTLPLNASVEIPVGYSIDIIQTGTGSVTVNPGTNAVSVNSKSNIRSLDGQYSKGTLVKIDTNTWFFFGNLLNAVTPVTPTAPTPVAPTPVAPTPVAPTPVAPTPTPPAPTPPSPTPPSPTPPSPTPPSPTPPAPTPTPPQLPTPTISVTSSGYNQYPNQVYTNFGIGNYDYLNTYTSTTATQNPEFPEEFYEQYQAPNTSYTVYITASRAGYTSATGSLTYTSHYVASPTPVAPTPTGPTTYNIYTYCDPLFPSMRGGAYGTQTAGTTVNTGTTSTQGLTSEQIVAQLGYAGGCPTVPIVNPGTVYLSYCNQGSPVVESFPINADNVLTTNINEACSVYTTLLTNIGATSIDCSTSSARVAPTNCATTPTPVAPTPVAPTPVAPTPVSLPSCSSPNTITNANSYTCAELGLTNLGGSSVYNIASNQQCCGPASPTPVAPTPVAPTPTATTYYAYGCCNGDPVVIDGPSNNVARNDYRSTTGCTESGVSTNYNTALANAQAACPTPVAPTPVAPTPVAPTYPTLLAGLRYCTNGDVPNPASPCTQTKVNNGDCVDGGASGSLCPTPVAPTPVAPTPVAPTPTAVCPPNDGRSYTNTRTTTNTCGDLGLTYVCTDGLFQYCLSATPVAPTPVAPTPVAPTPTAWATPLSGWHRCTEADAPNPNMPSCNGGNVGTCVNNSATGASCTDPSAPTPVAPTPVAPVAPTAPNCDYCDPQYSGGSCGQYGNGTLCYTPSGCPNRCDGDHAPTPTAPAPVAPVAPTAPSRYTCTPSDYANQCCSCYSVGACDANGSSWPAC